MSLETLKYLYDIRTAVERIRNFTQNRQFSDYQADDLLRSAVERQFEIVGEALNQLRRHDPQTAEQISGCQQAIALRNILIHGYADIDDEVVWCVIQDDLEPLHKDVITLMERC